MAHKCFGNYIDEKNCAKCIELKACKEKGEEDAIAALEKKAKKRGRPATKSSEKAEKPTDGAPSPVDLALEATK